MTNVQNAGNAVQARKARSGTGEQVTSHLNGDDLNAAAESTILATVAAIMLASLSVGCVIGIGIARTLGARP